MNEPKPTGYPISPVPFTNVQFADTFWRPRMETNRTVSIPFAFQKCEETGRVHNFERTAQVLRGEKLDNDAVPPETFPFDDTDLYKIIEGASYTLAVQWDDKLSAYLDALIAKIAAAQEPDGYLFTARTINPAHPHPWAGPERWVKEEELSHELYNLGHLFEAAAAHYQATGKRNLLTIALKGADLICDTFGPEKRAIYPGHQITEMGLCKLFTLTGEEQYLKLAAFLLDARHGGREYNQAHLPVWEQTEAVGHAVRAAYMVAGMADVAALTGRQDYVRALDAPWENVVQTKLYVTGGIGQKHEGEAFGEPYDLPNRSAYCETCAAIGNVYWNHRMFLLHGDAKYIDVMERTLYNALLAGVSLDGKAFFYPNPLESGGEHERSPWFGCACCPGNMTRFLASVPGYAYAVKDDKIYVNLYVTGTAKIERGNGLPPITLQIKSGLPWNETVKISVGREPSDQTPFTLCLRVPGWVYGEAVPGWLQEECVPSELYRFDDGGDEWPSASVNGAAVPTDVGLLGSGYLRLTRKWQDGDRLELSLPLSVRRIVADEKVEADRNRVALQYGPIVYCAEGVDNDGSVLNLVLPDDAELTPRFEPELLGGVVTLRGTAARNGKPVPFTAIPYYAWANRGKNEMAVWLKRR